MPCAGQGSRLGLPFPKELAPLGPGRALIDSSLDLVANLPYPRVILLEDGTREQTADYIRTRLQGVPLACIRQVQGVRDWPDGVLGLGPWLDGQCLILLPDCVYEASRSLLTVLSTPRAGISFAAVKAEREQVRCGGALAVRDGRVSAYADKPEHPGIYDAVWGAIAFSGSLGIAGLRIIAACTAGVDTAQSPVLGADVLWLDGFRDCGTWAGYRAELAGNRGAGNDSL